MRTLSRLTAAAIGCSISCSWLLACTTNTTPVANAPTVVVGSDEPNKLTVLKAKDNPSTEPRKEDAETKRLKALEKALEEAQEFGMLGLLGGSGTGTTVTGTLFGGSGQTNTIGGPVGVLGGSSGFGGIGGLGLKGTGVGGGGTGGGIGLGTLGTLGTIGGSGYGSLTTYGHGSGSGYGSYNNGERPKAKIDTATIQGPLPPEIVQRVLNDHREDFQDCYVLEASRGGRPRGKLTLAFTINNKGRVTEVRAPESTLAARDLQACIAQVIGTFEFPAPAKNGDETSEVTVLAPISF